MRIRQLVTMAFLLSTPWILGGDGCNREGLPKEPDDSYERMIDSIAEDHRDFWFWRAGPGNETVQSIGWTMFFKAHQNNPGGMNEWSGASPAVQILIYSPCTTCGGTREVFTCNGGGRFSGRMTPAMQTAKRIDEFSFNAGRFTLPIRVLRLAGDPDWDNWATKGTLPTFYPVEFCLRTYKGKEKFAYSRVYQIRGQGLQFMWNPGRPDPDHCWIIIEDLNLNAEAWWTDRSKHIVPQSVERMAMETASCACEPWLDTDNDSWADCDDGCPLDAGKYEPGICGCGVSDTSDLDGDGTIDCLDAWPHNRFTDSEPRSWGDMNNDGDVDMNDFAALQLCYSTVVSEPCWIFDADNDGQIIPGIEGAASVACASGPYLPAVLCLDGPPPPG